MPSVTDLAGTILLLETSEDLSAADEVKRWVRALGERDVLGAVAGILVARSPVSELGSVVPSANERTRWRDAQRETIIEQVTRYHPDAVICVGVPFRHTRPQWIIPHGGTVRLDRTASTVEAVRSTLSRAVVGRSFRCQVRPLRELFGMVMVVLLTSGEPAPYDRSKREGIGVLSRSVYFCSPWPTARVTD